MSPAPGTDALESRTRDRLLRLIGTLGPVTTPALAARLGLTETAVRRHVDNLLDEGLIEGREATGPRRRGRPARTWVLSPRAHGALSSGYDRLAEQALSFLAETAGPEAVTAFAQRRVADLEARYAAALSHVGDDPAARARALADALSADGYAASVRSVRPVQSVRTATGDDDVPGPDGIQICQGHCPVQNVAVEYPQFCDAEAEAFSRLLGVHVQRLATLAHGDHVCTTFVPTPAVPTRKASS